MPPEVWASLSNVSEKGGVCAHRTCPLTIRERLQTCHPMNSSPPSGPLILSIPNETLHHIFSFLHDSSPNYPFVNDQYSHDESFVQYQVNGKDYEVAQVLVLRSVCRHFRAITAELDFWYDAYFRFIDLIPPSYEDSFASFGPRYPERQFLTALFSDANLVKSLGQRKTDWRFESLEGLTAVMESVPLFVQNARAIDLEIMDVEEYATEPSDFDMAINAIASCSHITKLSTRLADGVNLSTIAASFPALETLSCRENNSFHGSLALLNRLRTLRLDFFDGDQPSPRLWLPLRSAETLTELSLQCGPDVDTQIFNTMSLDRFVNLKTLRIGPLCDSIIDSLIRGQIQLDVFGTTLIRRYVPINRFIDLLRAESLRNLKELELSDRHDDNSDRGATAQHWALVFDAFTSMLPSVQEVQLDAPLHLKCCQYFDRMVNLKLLNWDGSASPVFGCGRTNNPKAKIVKALDSAFANFMEKPQFAVHHIGSRET